MTKFQLAGLGLSYAIPAASPDLALTQSRLDNILRLSNANDMQTFVHDAKMAGALVKYAAGYTQLYRHRAGIRAWQMAGLRMQLQLSI